MITKHFYKNLILIFSLSGSWLQAGLPDMQTMLNRYHSLGENKQIQQERGNLSRSMDAVAAFMIQAILERKTIAHGNTKIFLYKDGSHPTQIRPNAKHDFFRCTIPMGIQVEQYPNISSSIVSLITALRNSREVSSMPTCDGETIHYLIFDEGDLAEYAIAKVFNTNEKEVCYVCSLASWYPEGKHE